MAEVVGRWVKPPRRTNKRVILETEYTLGPDSIEQGITEDGVRYNALHLVHPEPVVVSGNMTLVEKATFRLNLP